MMKLSIQQKQLLTLKMTPELRQSIELLHYDAVDLLAFLEELEQNNPLIELEYRSPIYDSSSSFLYDAQMIPSYVNDRQKLIRLANLHAKSADDQKLFTFIIQNLNKDGYFKMEATPFSTETLDAAILELQNVGPRGIAARSLQHCLLLQLDDALENYCFLRTLIAEDLEKLAMKDFNYLKRKYHCASNDFRAALDYIKTLNPRPCNFEADAHVNFLTTDIDVQLNGENLSFTINDLLLPHIKLNHAYEELYKAPSMKEYALNYHWAVKSLAQRNQTLHKIMQVLLIKQKLFFKHGYSELQPLTLENVAQMTNLHISTISRATSNKYISTPFAGSVPMKSLFSTEITLHNGTSISQTKLKLLVEKTILDENPTAPLSDQKITDYLKTQHGINVARRTITKYRDELHIPSTKIRKQLHT